jgi:hypothetical protein
MNETDPAHKITDRPSTHEGEVIRGKPARFVRITELHVELPQQPKSASFFTVQGQASAQAAE